MPHVIPLTLSALLAAFSLLTSSAAPPSLPVTSAEPPTAVGISREEAVVELPWNSKNRAVLYLCDGTGVSSVQVPLTTGADGQGLWDLLPQVKGRGLTGWTLPEDPWPVYGISVSMSQGDYHVLFCDGVWVDNLGNTLKVDADLPALWARFAGKAELQEGITLPFSQMLALRYGKWDSRFLKPSQVKAFLSDVPMTLDSTDNGLSWTIVNRGASTLSHANGAAASLEVLLDGIWYQVPRLDGPHWAVTAEGHTLKPGQSYSHRVWQESYGALPAGSYRLTFPLDTAHLPGSPPMEFYGCAGVPFRLGEGWALLPEHAGTNSK